MVESKYRTIWRRFWAIGVDALVFAPLYFFVYKILQGNYSEQIKLSCVIALLILTPMYSLFLHTLYGQTVGKMVMRVRVLDIHEQPISLKQAIIREIPLIAFFFIQIWCGLQDPKFLFQEYSFVEDVSEPLLYSRAELVFSVWSWLGILLVFCHSKRRTLHDFLAGTVVVKDL